MDPEKKWADQPAWFLNVIVEGDQELLRIQSGGKWTSIKYNGIEEIIKDQYNKGLLTVDFQAMLNMKTCPHCFGSRLKKESLHCFLSLEEKGVKKSDFKSLVPSLFVNREDIGFAKPENENLIKINIWDLQKMELTNLIRFLELYKNTSSKPRNLLERILNPLLDRASTIEELGLGYLMLTRGVDTISG